MSAAKWRNRRRPLQKIEMYWLATCPIIWISQSTQWIPHWDLFCRCRKHVWQAQWMAHKVFDKVPGANIETSTEGMRRRLEQIALESDETILSRDVKSLYTNVPVHEAIELACEAIYASSNPPEMQQPTFKKLMELAVINVWFMSGSDWYIQRDDIAMGASLAVILANIWLKKFEAQIAVETPAPQPPSLPRQKIWDIGVEGSKRWWPRTVMRYNAQPAYLGSTEREQDWH